MDYWPELSITDQYSKNRCLVLIDFRKTDQKSIEQKNNLVLGIIEKKIREGRDF